MDTVDVHQEASTNWRNVNDLVVGQAQDKMKPACAWLKSFIVTSGQRSQQVSFKIDTGAEAKIISQTGVERLGANIQPSSATLTSYTRDRICNLGCTQLILGLPGKADGVGTAWFEVVEGGCSPPLF